MSLLGHTLRSHRRILLRVVRSCSHRVPNFCSAANDVKCHSRPIGFVRHRSKPRPYLQAGSPLSCFLPSCRKPFTGTCIHANDGHFYCSGPCTDEGAKLDLTRVQDLKRKV